MKVYLMDKDKLTKFDLPSNGEDFFSYNYIVSSSVKNCLITFEKKNNKWMLKSNGIVNICEDNNILQNVEILEYSYYKLKVMGYPNDVMIFFMSFKDEQLYKLDINNLSNIIIGKNNSSNICYLNNNIADIHAIFKKNGTDWIVNFNEKKEYCIYINGSNSIPKKIKAGDTIFIYGLTVIWMHNFIIINNPNNLVKVLGLTAYNSLDNILNTDYLPVNDEDQNFKLYNEEDYFYHVPRIKEVVESEELVIDSPPNKEIREDLPWYLSLGSSLTMGAMSFMMIWNLVGNITNGKKIVTLIPQIIMLVAMLFGSLILPRILSSYQKKKSIEKELKRVEKYSAYLDKKEKEIQLKLKRYTQIMNDNYIPANIVKSIAMTNNNRNFWSREISDDDFLRIRLGLGSIDSPLKLQAPKEVFCMNEDELLNRVYQISDKYKKLNDVPITIPMTEKNVLAFICSSNYFDFHDYFSNILVQLVGLHSGADLKIVIFTNEANKEKWSFAKFLPHCWSEDKSLRYFATNQEEIIEISNVLEEEFKQRKNLLSGKEKRVDDKTIDSKLGYSNFYPYFVIICDNYKNNLRMPIVENILENKDINYGFSFAVITNTMRNLPAKCDTFVEIGVKDGCILERNISSKNQQVFNVEYDNDIDMNAISKSLLNIPLLTKEGMDVLPSSLSFLEMYGVSKIEQLNILNRWQSNNPVNSLAATIGVYANGEQFKLNLHEKFHGPHGLIAGSTGSGKSEFIITYILSMCINYHPYEVQFVLIDYKGGGLAGAFENRETGIRIPHLAGTITNLDTAEMNRTLVSIESELKRRQKIFNETRDTLGESTIDIYKYQKLYREGAVKIPMAHLFIISDEFAELKSQQPEFMQQLISTARIGRSLGVHLILATQKPSGVVNDQIWSNSKFKICLKVQDRSDSMEVLKKPDAASIKEAGRFYLQVGYDDFFDKGQSGWSGAKYIPSDKIIKKVDDSISFINNTGGIFKSIKDVNKVETKHQDFGDQLTNIVKFINQIGENEKICPNRLWLDAIPGEIYINTLKKKYNYKHSPWVINPVIGEYDNPKEQEQGLLTLNLDNNGNTLIIGSSGSGKEMLLSTILLSSIVDHTPEEVNFYIIDCGTESLKVFRKMPHVGDIATVEDKDLIFGMFEMLYEELESRKEVMSDYEGNYIEYNKNSKNKLPLLVTIINNYDIFNETYNKLSDNVSTLYRDGARYGILFIISALTPTTMRSKIMQLFPNKLCLQLANEIDYRNYFNAPKGLFPAKKIGRGISFIDKNIYEFQTALFMQKEKINQFIKTASNTYRKAYKVSAKKIPVVPDKVYLKDIIQYLNGLSNVPIGYDISTKQVLCYDFSNSITQIATNTMNEERMSFLYSLVTLLSKIPKTKVKIFDFVDAYEKNDKDVICYNKNYDETIINIHNEILREKDSDINTIYMFLGIGMYKNLLSASGKQILDKLFTEVTQFNNTKFIIMDVLVSFKNILIESWYQSNVDNSNGIWLDSDAANQLVMNAPNLTVEERKMNFPFISFVINKNNHKIIKHVIELKEGNKDGK